MYCLQHWLCIYTVTMSTIDYCMQWTLAYVSSLVHYFFAAALPCYMLIVMCMKWYTKYTNQKIYLRYIYIYKSINKNYNCNRDPQCVTTSISCLLYCCIIQGTLTLIGGTFRLLYPVHTDLMLLYILLLFFLCRVNLLSPYRTDQHRGNYRR